MPKQKKQVLGKAPKLTRKRAEELLAKKVRFRRLGDIEEGLRKVHDLSRMPDIVFRAA